MMRKKIAALVTTVSMLSSMIPIFSDNCGRFTAD